jgi:hypothetical protein
MRWKPKPKPELGTYRARPWFAWYPVTVDDEKVWLETVTVIEVYQQQWDITCGISGPQWVTVRFKPAGFEMIYD